jgi:hypothetical protein
MVWLESSVAVFASKIGSRQRSGDVDLLTVFLHVMLEEALRENYFIMKIFVIFSLSTKLRRDRLHGQTHTIRDCFIKDTFLRFSKD